MREGAALRFAEARRRGGCEKGRGVGCGVGRVAGCGAGWRTGVCVAGRPDLCQQQFGKDAPISMLNQN